MHFSHLNAGSGSKATKIAPPPPEPPKPMPKVAPPDGADGRVSSSRVQKSSGSPELDRAAVNALGLCKFKPAMNGGAAEAGWAQIAYVWSLDE